MRPVLVEGHNIDMVKPEGWDESRDGTCLSLPVRREVTGTGNEAKLSFTSNWQPSPQELALLAQGGVVELCCLFGQYPVSINVVRKYDPPPAIQS